METLNQNYWEGRYAEASTGWDIGEASAPLKAYIDQLADKDLRILIPGAGNAHEAAYLWEKGFRNVYVLDIAEAPLANFLARVADFPPSQLVQGDFFSFRPEAPFDLILEQTFFCALAPHLRQAYVEQMHALLAPGGKLAGVLFNIPLYADRPPFGGHAEAYRELFLPYFELKHFEACHNSIPPRAGNELFICLSPRQRQHIP